jgi:hypothetical protein
LVLAENKAESAGAVMLFSTEQQQRLEALGIRLLVTIPNPNIAESGAQDDGFWQTQLGCNIRKVAKNIDMRLLPIAKTGEKHFAKRLIWQKIRMLLKSQ